MLKKTPKAPKTCSQARVPPLGGGVMPNGPGGGADFSALFSSSLPRETDDFGGDAIARVSYWGLGNGKNNERRSTGLYR